MIHDDLHMMPPTTSFALDHPERLRSGCRRAQHLFNLFRTLFLFGRRRAIGRDTGRREPASQRQARTLDALL